MLSGFAGLLILRFHSKAQTERVNLTNSGGEDSFLGCLVKAIYAATLQGTLFFPVFLHTCAYEVFMLHGSFLQHPLSQSHKAMATIVNFSGIAPCQRMRLKPKAGPAIMSSTIKRTCKFVQQNRADAKKHSIYVKNQAGNELSSVSTRFSIMAAMGNSIFSSGSLSPSDTINEFYQCINEKNLKQLSHYISTDCYIEECSFSTPLQGKKVIMKFFKELTEAMGENIKFTIQHVCEGNDQLTAAANWHMEWKDKQIPFTRGCSFFECSTEGEKLIIKKAQIVIESPIKPGHLVLSLLKAVTSLFDGFPRTTEWFLRSPHIVFQWIWRIYKIMFAPIIEGYIGLWNMAIRLLSYAYNILLYISNMFFK